MFTKETRKREFFRLATLVIFSAVLAACVPINTAQETRPAITQTSDSGVEIVPATTIPEPSATLENNSTPENTPTATLTAMPKNTPTPEATAIPEAMTQAEIRAEILAAGVNLDDLANSQDEWTSSHKSIDTIQNALDHRNFKTGEVEDWFTTVVIGLEAVETKQQFDQALLTDGGWQLTTFAKLAYKSVDGNWQIVKLPLNAYHAETDRLWAKNYDVRNAAHFIPGEVFINDNGTFNIPFINTWTSKNVDKNHYDTGSFIQIFTAWVKNPQYANNDCGSLGDPPRYSEEQLIEFRKTGDPSIFGYQDRDGYYILWPVLTFDASLSDLDFYNHD
jgi:hypothetical protein